MYDVQYILKIICTTYLGTIGRRWKKEKKDDTTNECSFVSTYTKELKSALLVRSYCIESDQKNWQTLFIHYCYLFFIAIFFQYLRSGTFKGSFLAIKVERNSNKALSTYLVLSMYTKFAQIVSRLYLWPDWLEGCKKLTTFWLTAQSSTRVITIMIIMKLKCFSNISLGTVLSSPKKGGYCEKIALLMLSSFFFKVCQKEWLQKSLKQHTEWRKKFKRHWFKKILSFQETSKITQIFFSLFSIFRALCIMLCCMTPFACEII